MYFSIFYKKIIIDGSVCFTVEKNLGYTPIGGNSIVVVDASNALTNSFTAITRSYDISNGKMCIVNISNIKGNFNNMML